MHTELMTYTKAVIVMHIAGKGACTEPWKAERNKKSDLTAFQSRAINPTAATTSHKCYSGNLDATFGTCLQKLKPKPQLKLKLLKQKMHISFRILHYALQLSITGSLF